MLKLRKLPLRKLPWTAFVLAMVVSMVLVACGGDDDEDPTATTAPPTAAPTAAPPTVTSAPPTAAPTRAPTATAAPVPGVFNVNPNTLKVIKYRYNAPNFSLTPKPGGTLKISSSVSWPNLDPIKSVGSGTNGPLSVAHNRLVRCAAGLEMKVFDPYTCEIVPDLASSWSASADGKTWTFKLRPDAKFQNIAPVNGRAVTSADILFSYDYAWKTQGSALASNFANVDSVTAPDAQTVVIAQKSVSADFLAVVPAGIQHYILAKEIKDASGSFENQMIGTGPYQVKEVKGKEQIIYVKNPTFFKPGQPYMDAFEYGVITDGEAAKAAFRAGQQHWTNLPGANYTVRGSEEIRRTVPNAVYFETIWPHALYSIVVNLESGPTANVKVRQAMSLAYDRPGVVKDIYQDAGTIMSPVPWPWIFDQRPKLDEMPNYQYNPTKAKQLLTEAGFPNGFEIQMDYSRGALADHDLSSPIFVDNLKAIGITVKLNPVDFTTLRGNAVGYKFGGGTFYFVGTQSTIDSYVYNHMHSASSGNVARIKDQNLDKLLDNQRVEMDPAKRKDILKQIWQAEHDNVWRIPAPTLAAIYFHSEKLHNALFSYQYLMPNIFGPNLEYMWLD
ncbi:MAG: ABC transporter substrate-binding protein [Chloroflexi bacterium]|nr:ABC transporter substrate-binding protein [Chloroflexota bacterium]